ncbi:hemerythrin domain-containing protein [Rhizobium alvei]|uniref:Hemerythrin domain-containing protein n=1 Tax=Rhizobium alvei TaxID=1132659 RepID=A0ABT8YIL9_9HYPH|nr:hemerythrin domain-containing protein [Rhizobium alvei]MDO6963173.1 hemerythrin domain-containing protein [Rhizobium alvei]
MTMSAENLSLLERAGLPADMQILLAKYPRADWESVHTIGHLGQFWISRHDMFRELGGALVASIDHLREEKIDAAGFARWFAPRLNHFLGDLEGHHQIEDYQYFPMFAAADQRLAKGFDLLEQDHHLIHEMLERNASAAQAFHGDLIAGADRLAFSRDAYAKEAESLLTGLLRHLEDEEDLLIPLLIDQGEEKFGGY